MDFIDPTISSEYKLRKRDQTINYQNGPPFSSNGDFYYLDIYNKNFEQVGWCKVGQINEQLCIVEIDIYSQFQGKGAGTFIYDFLEWKYQRELHPSPILEEMGLDFWIKRIIKKQSIDNLRYKNVNHPEIPKTL